MTNKFLMRYKRATAIFIAISAALFLAFFVFMSLEAVSSLHRNTSTNARDIRGIMADLAFGNHWNGILATALAKAQQEGRITPEDYPNLDFTWPDQPGFGSDEAFEVFNPKSPRTVAPVIPEQRLIDAITTLEGTRINFNLRRYIRDDDGVWFDRLVAVLPNMSVQACEALGAPVEVLKSEIDIPSDNHRVVVDGSWKATGCVETVDHKLYWFIGLVSRMKKSGSDKWTF